MSYIARRAVSAAVCGVCLGIAAAPAVIAAPAKSLQPVEQTIVVQEKPTPPLVQAEREQDAAKVKALLASKPDVNAADNDGSTALHWAAHWRDLDTVKALLKAGANPNAATQLGATPLYLAATNGDAATIKLLLGAKADANGRALANGETPLMLASRSGDVQSVQLLLKAGAKVNDSETYRNTTALMWASEQNNTAVVKVLLSHGADAAAASKVEPVTTSGMVTARSAALQDPNIVAPAAAAAAFEGSPGKPTPASADGKPAGAAVEGSSGATPPAAASGNSGSSGAPKPVARGPRPPREVQGGMTALVLAARENSMASAEALLAAGAPVNEQSGDGSTALLIAIQNVHIDMANMLLSHGADPSLANKRGWNPLYLAVKDRSMEVGTMPAPPGIDRDQIFALIKTLVEKGANVNARVSADTEMRNAIKATWLNEPGATPFLRASLCGDVPVMEYLMAHGADPKIATTDGTTALAALSGVGFTKGFMQDIDGPDVSLKAVQMLIDAGIDVNAANKDKVTALHGAAHKNFVGAIQLLVDHGADLTAVSQRRGTFERSKEFKGNTVLDWAYGVQTGGESSVYHPEAVALVTKLMTDKKLPLVRFETTDGGIGAVAALAPAKTVQGQRAQAPVSQ